MGREAQKRKVLSGQHRGGRAVCRAGAAPPPAVLEETEAGVGTEDPSPRSTGLVTLNFLTSVLASYTSRTWAE